MRFDLLGLTGQNNGVYAERPAAEDAGEDGADQVVRWRMKERLTSDQDGPVCGRLSDHSQWRSSNVAWYTVYRCRLAVDRSTLVIYRLTSSYL